MNSTKGRAAAVGAAVAGNDARTLERRLLRQMSRLNRSFGLLEAGDRVMVCLSGGKDSWSLLGLLAAYRRMLPFDYELVAVNLDQGPLHQAGGAVHLGDFESVF